MAMPSPSAVTPVGSATWAPVVIPVAIGPGARASRTHVVHGVRLAAPQEVEPRSTGAPGVRRAFDRALGVRGSGRRRPCLGATVPAVARQVRRRPGGVRLATETTPGSSNEPWVGYVPAA